jgi:hypothetical protein
MADKFYFDVEVDEDGRAGASWFWRTRHEAVEIQLSERVDEGLELRIRRWGEVFADAASVHLTDLVVEQMVGVLDVGLRSASRRSAMADNLSRKQRRILRRHWDCSRIRVRPGTWHEIVEGYGSFVRRDGSFFGCWLLIGTLEEVLAEFERGFYEG